MTGEYRPWGVKVLVILICADELWRQAYKEQMIIVFEKKATNLLKNRDKNGMRKR